MSPVPKQAAQIQESLAFHNETGTGKRQAITTPAGNTGPGSCKREPKVQLAGSTFQRGSCPKPAARALESVCCHRLPPGPTASFLSSCSKTNVCLMQPFPSCSSTKLCAGTSICSVYSTSRKSCRETQFTQAPHGSGDNVCSYFAKENTHFPTIKGWYLQLTKSCQILHLLGSKNIHR